MVEGVDTAYRSELYQKASLLREGDHEVVEGVNTDYRLELHPKASLLREGDHEVVEGVDTASFGMTLKSRPLEGGFLGALWASPPYKKRRAQNSPFR